MHKSSVQLELKNQPATHMAQKTSSLLQESTAFQMGRMLYI